MAIVTRGTSAAARRLIALAGNTDNADEAATIVAARLLDGVATAPTDLFAIARKLNVTVGERDIDYDGHLVETADGLRIEIASSASPTRKRFTFAHELGHAVFASTGPRYPREGEELERLCDRLAVELLMPRGAFVAALKEPLTFDLIRDVASLFGISITACAVRCAELRNVLVLEATTRDIVWSRAPFVTRGPLSAADVAVKNVIERTLSDGQTHGFVHLNTRSAFGWWYVDGNRLGTERCLLLFRRAAHEEVQANRMAVIT